MEDLIITVRDITMFTLGNKRLSISLVLEQVSIEDSKKVEAISRLRGKRVQIKEV